MKLRFVLASLVVAMLLFLPVGGCSASATPLAQSVQARELYTSTLDILVTARRLGKIDNTTYGQIEASRVVAAAALDQMEAAALRGDAVAGKTAADTFNRAVDVLLEWRIRSQSKQ